MCRICGGAGFYMICRDPDLDEVCTCRAGDVFRGPWQNALNELMHAFDGERT